MKLSRLKHFTVRRVLIASLICPFLFVKPAHADLWGGDVAVLTQILTQAIMQLQELQTIVGTGKDSFRFAQEINSGIRDGLSVIRFIDPRLTPGLYSDARTAQAVLSQLLLIYGRTPQTAEKALQDAQDQSVAESIAMNGNLYTYANDISRLSQQMLDHAKVVSPQGAGKLTAQSLAVLTDVSSQTLKTNAMMLKMMSQQMALANRGQKLQSQQFKTQYDGLSKALGQLPKNPKLASVKR